MYLVKILNADHRPVDVEVSLEIYRVYEESRKQEERQRYERRKHIEGKSFDDCLLYDLATEPLEETAERLETLLEIDRSGGYSESCIISLPAKWSNTSLTFCSAFSWRCDITAIYPSGVLPWVSTPRQY